MRTTASIEDVNKIINSEHYDPFQILGVHKYEVPNETGISVRTFLPSAKNVIIVHNKEKMQMEKIHNEGFFEALFKDADFPFEYHYEIEYFDGNKVSAYDPYSFSPILTEYDRHLFAEGNHHKIYDKLGAHMIEVNEIEGVHFAVWAPNAKRVSVVGNFNGWDGRVHPMRVLGTSGIWEIFLPELPEYELYKFEVKTSNNQIIEKSDPYAYSAEIRPKTASIIYDINKYKWNDEEWMDKRKNTNTTSGPISIYEVHLGSWMRVPEEDNRPLTYRELATRLVRYVKDMEYTHIELMPVAEHPFDGSWGYQVTGYYAITSRYGSPEDFMYFIDVCHQNDIGVIVDWVPAHFPKDIHGLAQFDGTALYEHQDPKLGEHPDWGTLIFNYGRKEVKNFLVGNALFLFDKYHLDGVRVDAVASMLYLDYGKEGANWVPNQYGGRENLAAIEFMQHLNSMCYQDFPGIITIAEESTAWPGVSRPTFLGGLGFGLKWNMGWMNDLLVYMTKDPVHRSYHQDMITFALLYAFQENFVLVLSHDEVVHGKNSMLSKMPGPRWEKFANLRAFYGFMYGHPGKKLLFMGGEIGQYDEWNHEKSIDWHLIEYTPHRRLQHFVKDLNHILKTEKALYEKDFDSDGFEWIDFHDKDNCIISFSRKGNNPNDILIFVCNFTPVPRFDYRVGTTQLAFHKELINSDSEKYWGSNLGNFGGVFADNVPWHGKPYSIKITVPPLATVIFKPIYE